MMSDFTEPGDRVIVSACLLGMRSRYDGEDALREQVLALAKDRVIIPVCPEQMGGLPTPRPKAEIHGGDGRDVLKGMAEVMDEKGSRVTDNFLKGAEEALKVARVAGANKALLKEKSPSCGVSTIIRDSTETPGTGVTAALLLSKGIDIKGIW